MKHVTKDTAVLLKEKGFDLPCRQYYHVKQNTPKPNNSCHNDYNTDPLLSDVYISAPTLYEATEWLRAKGVHVSVVPVNLWQQWRMFIYVNSYPPQKSRIPDKPMDFPTHDLALEAGIIHALKYLP